MVFAEVNDIALPTADINEVDFNQFCLCMDIIQTIQAFKDSISHELELFGISQSLVNPDHN